MRGGAGGAGFGDKEQDGEARLEIERGEVVAEDVL
jgi:hypothetical protein